MSMIHFSTYLGLLQIFKVFSVDILKVVYSVYFYNRNINDWLPPASFFPPSPGIEPAAQQEIEPGS